MLNLETLQTLHAKLQQGLQACRNDEATAMERRLRQEGALLAVEQLLRDAQEPQPIDVQTLAIPLAELEGDNGGNH